MQMTKVTFSNSTFRFICVSWKQGERKHFNKYLLWVTEIPAL